MHEPEGLDPKRLQEAAGEMYTMLREMLQVIYSGNLAEFTRWAGYDMAEHARTILKRAERQD